MTSPLPRRPKPTPPPPITYRSFAASNDFGECEAPDCTAPARATCPDCGAEMCRGHIEHASHA